MSNRFERYWHTFFEFGVLIKGFNGVLETVGGVLILFLSKSAFGSLFSFLARGELLQNLPAGAKTFAAIYILLHGILNIFLAIQLYRNRLWAYLATISAMILFIFYQIYRINLHHSITLTVVTIFDLLFIALAWHEYQYQKRIIVDKSRF